MRGEEKLLTIAEASRFLHVCPNTLRAWEKQGTIVPMYTKGGQRRYSKDDLWSLVGRSQHKKPKKVTVGYCRVSSSGQKQDLERQATVVTNYCERQGYQFKIIKDIGSGLNYKKKGLQELVRLICDGEVERIVVNYKDRLLRFGYDLLEQFCDEHEVQIEVINQTEEISAEDELVKDMLSIITVFSARLYGSRSHKNQEIIKKSREMFEGGKEDAKTSEGDQDGAC